MLSMALDKYPLGVAIRMADRKFFLKYFTHAESIRCFYEEVKKQEGPYAMVFPSRQTASDTEPP